MSKEAMKLALEALEEFSCDSRMIAGEPQLLKTRRAITSLRQAIAEAEKQEPVGEIVLWRGEKIVQWEQSLPVGTKLYTTPPAKQEQGEPVAYIHRNEYNEYRLEPHDDFDIKSIPFNVDVPLFKSPQQRTWVGLTDEEINDLVHSHDDFDGLWEFADAVEAKLKEKNNA